MRSKKIILLSVLCVLFSSVQIFAQSYDWYYGKPIHSVTFKGLKNVKRTDLDSIVNAFVGKSFSDEVFSDLLNRVFALNYFEDVNPNALPADKNYDAVRIELDVIELPVVTKVSFNGRKKVSASDIRGVIETKAESIYDDSKRVSDERRILDLYLSKGFTEASVSSSVEENESGFSVTFDIHEGEQCVIKYISFTGNSIVSDRTLKSKLALKQTSVFNKGAFMASTVEQDKITIMRYYQDNGYIDVRILNVTIDAEYNEKRDRQELSIQYHIEEGSQYTFGGITYTGNRAFSTEELMSLMKLKQGNVFNATKFQQGLSAAQSKYWDNGYITCAFNPSAERDSFNKILTYRVNIAEGRRSHIESITVRGNDRTKDYVVMREIPIEPGDIFSNKKIQTALRDLYNLQYFSQVAPDMKPGSEDGLADVVFNVVEQSTRSVQFGLTFSGTTQPDEFPVALFASIQDSNIAGTGRSVSASAEVSTSTQSISVGYGQNWIFGMPVSSNTSLSFSHSNLTTTRNVFLPDGTLNRTSFFMPYEQYKFSLSQSFSRRWTPDFAIISAGTGFSTNLLTNIYDDSIYSPSDTNVTNYHGSWNTKNSIFAALSVDGRNNIFDPSRGWFASQRFTWYGLIPKDGIGFLPEGFGENEFFLRSATVLEKYFTLFDAPITDTYNLKAILMGYSGLNMQKPFFDSAIRRSSKLYIDGTFHGRGWTISDEDYARGNLLWNNTLELRVPVVPNIIAVDAFFDASMVKPNIEDFSDLTNENDWFFSWGPGMRLLVQQMPLRLFLVSNFKVENGDVVWKDADGDTLKNMMSSWHFVVSFNTPNR